MFKGWIEKIVIEVILGLLKAGNLGDALKGVKMFLDELTKVWPPVAGYEKVAVCYVYTLSKKTSTQIDDVIVETIAQALGVDTATCTP